MFIYFNFLILISEIFYRWDDLNLNTNSLTDVLLKEEMKKTANELLDSMQDTRFSETEFLQFVDNLKNQNQTNENSNLEMNETLWKNSLKEGLSDQELGNLSLEADKWVEEFQKTPLEGAGDMKKSFWDDLSEEWNTASKYSFNLLNDFFF
jgi:hypothetical protein